MYQGGIMKFKLSDGSTGTTNYSSKKELEKTLKPEISIINWSIENE